MRHPLLCFATTLLGLTAFSVGLQAIPSGIHDIDIKVSLRPDGTADITERWEVSAGEGTEWYLVRNNLGDIVIGDLAVSDETGRSFILEEEWDSHRSRFAKEGRCGLLHTAKGVEICWGIGDYGDHTWTVSYTMSNAVKSLTDADMLHLQLLSPGLSSTPEHVSVSIGAPGLTKDNVRFWGFGFEGRSEFGADGSVNMESTGRINSVIVLLRFDKGLFHSPSVQNRRFEDVLAEALEGAGFEDEEDKAAGFLGALIGLLSLVGFVAVPTAFAVSAGKKKILGCKPSKVDWSREVPFGGNLPESYYTLSRLGEVKKSNSFASALILRMIYSGAITVLHKEDGKVELAFGDTAPDTLNPVSKELYDMMKEASGSDSILQDKEFSRWSKKHYKEVGEWVENAAKNGREALRSKALMQGDKYSANGQAEARKLLGFRKFLSDFTLISERGSRDVGLWQDYLVFGALYGIADKVAKELHDIDPKFLEEVTRQDYPTTAWLLWHNNNLAGAITNAQARDADAMSRRSGSFGGFGGGTSFGGGGGFSGGGFGGGAR